MSRYELPGATEVQMAFQRARADGDIRRLLDSVADLGLSRVADGVIALTPLGTRLIGEWLGLGAESDLLVVRVALRESTDPKIWRRLQVPSDIRLDRFHQVLGAAMGWEDSHLHVFERGSERYGFAEPDLDIRDHRELTLGGLLTQPGDQVFYEYDFGDSWKHDIVLEAVTPNDGDDARCIAGEGRCPPEDVGGIHGYENLRGVLARPANDGYQEALDWLGLERAADFDPAAFSVEDANHAIKRMLSAVWI
ncbi:MAG: plasmid pRiA4b ORF-3 family protein [Solirubrobacteraceae bacterium]